MPDLPLVLTDDAGAGWGDAASTLFVLTDLDLVREAQYALLENGNADANGEFITGSIDIGLVLVDSGGANWADLASTGLA